MFKNPIFYLLQDEKNISGEIFQRKPLFLGQWNVIVFQDNIPTYPAISIYLSIYLFLTYIYLNANTYIYIYYILYMCSPTGVASMKPFSDLFVSASVVAEAWQVFGAASCLDSVWCGAHGAQRSYRGTQRPVRCIPLRIWVIYTCNIYIWVI